MSREFAHDIIENLSDDRSLEVRRGVAEAITSESGSFNQEVIDTEQDTYLLEEAKWEEKGQTQKVTALRENGTEAYVLWESNSIYSGNDSEEEFDLEITEDAVYSSTVDTRQDFKKLISSIKGQENEPLYKSELDDYAASTGLGE